MCSRNGVLGETGNTGGAPPRRYPFDGKTDSAHTSGMAQHALLDPIEVEALALKFFERGGFTSCNEALASLAAQRTLSPPMAAIGIVSLTACGRTDDAANLCQLLATQVASDDTEDVEILEPVLEQVEVAVREHLAVKKLAGDAMRFQPRTQK